MPSAFNAAALLALLLAGCDEGETPEDDTGPTGTDADEDGWTVERGDCDDGDPSIHPEADEVVDDRIDQDCDGGDTCYQDSDGDGYGSTQTVASEDLDCLDPGESTHSTDCDDRDPAISPGAEETIADGVDQDCDGGDLCYADGDGDGYGTKATVASADLDCLDTGESVEHTDCDDADPGAYPGGLEEPYDGVDQDCDDADLTDVDGDGYDAEVVYGEDCDDSDPEVHPGAPEIQDGADDDCDGLVDCEDGDCTTCVCTETACDDGLDDDDDGLADCEDDDCWGLACHPAGVRARVQGGYIHAWWDRYHRRERAAYDGYWIWHSAHTGDVTSAWGTVQVLPSGATSWSATPARTTCTWRVAHASFSFDFTHRGCTERWDWGGVYDHGAGPVRSGFEVDDGCRLAGSSFLPPRLIMWNEGDSLRAIYASHWRYPPPFHPPYTTWYLGPAGHDVGTSTHWTSSYSGLRHPPGHSWWGTIYVSETDWSGSSTAVLGPADTWTALP